MIFGSPPIVTNGLVLNLDAANTKSYPKTGTVWNDLSGNGNSGTFVSGSTFSSTNVGNIIFNGTTQYADCGNNSSINFSNSITAAAWIKGGGGSVYKGIIDKGRDNYGAWSLCLDEVLTKVSFKARISGVNRLVTTNASYVNTIWTQILATFDGTDLKIYVNGQIDNSATYAGTIGTNSISVRIGAANDGLYFGGSISNAQVYNRALSASEVQQNYNAQKSRFNL